ncbi:alanine racemase [Thermoanaerobacterium sp. DL9XJH110]|uniref:alanine racemase n=1 Tax=Thermoanaerobacterium sp. DL9XJH110 TaxID=3386643 RepID=UPI003BB6E5C6
MHDLTSWVDIDLDAISKNIKAVKDYIGNVKLLAVVKADAYGHGLVPVARCAVENGVDYLGVSTLEEGIALRENGIKIPVLIFNVILPEQAETVLQYDLTATVCSFDVVQALNEASVKLNRKACIHLKVDTGFGRFGILPEHAVEFFKIIDTSFKNIYIEGVYTHFSSAFSETITRKQFNIFKSVLKRLEKEGYNIPLKHACNSTAALKYPDMHLDMVRIGNLMYGLCPSHPLDIQKPARVFSKVVFIKKLPAGHNVGYCNRFKTKRPTVVAVIPFGYYDGLELQVSQPCGLWESLKGFIKQILIGTGITSLDRKVRINGQYCNIIGKIGMQSCMADVTGLKDIVVGDIVEITARKVNLRYNLPRVYHTAGRTFTDLRQEFAEIYEEHEGGKRREISIG